MVAPDPDSTPADPALNAPPGPPPEASASGGGQGRLVGIALVAGLLAGLAGWLVSETILEAYGSILSPKVRREADVEAGRRAMQAQLQSAAGTFAGLGATVGLGLGLAGGLARRSASAGVRAALLGCLVGSGAGASTSLLVLPHFYKNHDPHSQDMRLPLLTLGSIASSVGAAGGLAFAIGLGGRSRWTKTLVGGMVGAALATVVYEVVGGIAFPADRTELPISQTPVTRAMLHVLVATLTAIGSALALGLSSGAKGAAPPAS